MYLMHSIFREQLDDFIVIFLDDILVYSRDLISHVAHVRKTFEILRQHFLYAKVSKCEFLKSNVHYLGHVFSEQGLLPDPAKVQAVANWKVLQNVSEIRSFLGLAVTFSVIGSICVHVPMSLRARISAPDEWHRIKSGKSD